MAEAVGLAASIAGIVGLTGQLLKGIFFVQQFLRDTKDAPNDVRELSEEVELLLSAAQKTESLLVKCQRDGLDFDLEEERKALKRYTDMVMRLGVKIEKDVKRFSGGKDRWWDRVKTASKKNSLAGYMAGIERAKTLLLDVEMKIMINFQHNHQEVLKNTRGFLQTLQSTVEDEKTIINQILVKSAVTETWTESTDVTLANLSRGMDYIKRSVDGLAPAIQQEQFSKQHEIPTLEKMIESAVMRGLKRHNDELGTDRSPKVAKTVLSNQAVIDSCGSDWKGLGNHNIFRGFKSIRRSYFRTPLFDIEFVTKEALPRPAFQTQGPTTVHSEEEVTSSQRFTNYRIRIKPLSWWSELSLEPGSSNMRYNTSFHKCLRFRTYNVVPWDSPIIQACRDFDTPEVKRLFDAGHASPYDSAYPLGNSLVAIVFMGLFSRSSVTLTEATKGVELLKFLIHCLGDDIGSPGRQFFSAFDFWSNIGKSQHLAEMAEKWTEAFRLGLAHSSEDPFDGKNIAKRLSISFSQTPLYSVLMSQQQWWIETQVEDSCIDIDERDHFFETNLQMLRDPSGLSMQKAIARGDCYIPYTPNSRPGAARSPIHSLLNIAAITWQDDLHRCVVARLSFLLSNDYQIYDAYHIHDFGHSFYPGYYTLTMPLSCTGYANFLGLIDLWESALIAALWNPNEIQNIFDTDLYAGIPELLRDGLVYQTCDDQRATFIHELLRGEYRSLDHSTILTISIVLQNELGVWWPGINQMIRDVDICFKTRIIPGGWPTDLTKMIMPGIDFKLPSGGEFDDDLFGDVQDWKYIQDIWGRELDGSIPPECSLPRKQCANVQDHLQEEIKYAQSQMRFKRSRIILLESELVEIRTNLESLKGGSPP